MSLLPVFSGIHVARFLVFRVVFCRSLFVLLSLALSVLRFTASDSPFGIFKLFLFVSTRLKIIIGQKLS